MNGSDSRRTVTGTSGTHPRRTASAAGAAATRTSSTLKARTAVVWPSGSTLPGDGRARKPGPLCPHCPSVLPGPCGPRRPPLSTQCCRPHISCPHNESCLKPRSRRHIFVIPPRDPPAGRLSVSSMIHPERGRHLALLFWSCLGPGQYWLSVCPLVYSFLLPSQSITLNCRRNCHRRLSSPPLPSGLPSEIPELAVGQLCYMVRLLGERTMILFPLIEKEEQEHFTCRFLSRRNSPKLQPPSAADIKAKRGQKEGKEPPRSWRAR